MASAIAALSGEMKRFESGLVSRAISPNRLKANRLSALMSPVSAALSVRGSAVMGRGAVREASWHCATSSPPATASRERTIDLMSDSFPTGSFLAPPRPF